MFLGSIPDAMRRIVHEHAAAWPKGCDVYVGCSGNLTIERVLAPLGFRFRSCDVNPYSCALGWHFSGQPLPFALKESSREELGWLEPYLDDGPSTLAVLMLGTNFLASVGRDNLYHRRQVQAYRDQWEALHAKTLKRVTEASLTLESFAAADVMGWLDGVPDEVPVAVFPPFYGSSGYESMFAGISEHFTWPAPDYQDLDEDGMDRLVAAITGRRYWLAGLHVRRPELEDALRGIVRSRTHVPVYVYGSSGHPRLVTPQRDLEQVLMPKIGLEDELGRRMALHPLSEEQFAWLRAQFLTLATFPARPRIACAVSVDGKIIGAFAYTVASYAPDDAYLLSDFAVPWTRYKRLAKLVVMAALSTEAQILLQRRQSRRFHMVTTSAWTDNPQSQKYGRGIPGMKLAKREPANDGVHAYQLMYRAPFGQWNLKQALVLWRQRHGSAR